LREVAQIVLATFFQACGPENHKKLLESVLNECELVRSSDTSRQVQSAAFQRLKVAREIFGSKISGKTVV
jgi:hypothetical protein